MSRQSDYITEVRQTNRQLWEAINKLVSLQREWQALDYGSTLIDFLSDDKENSGEHKKLQVAQIGAVVFDTTDAFVSMLDAGHATNMAHLL